eukprot:scaffold1063_cov60-Phaeocystis_antarctica.AAC.4
MRAEGLGAGLARRAKAARRAVGGAAARATRALAARRRWAHQAMVILYSIFAKMGARGAIGQNDQFQ